MAKKDEVKIPKKVKEEMTEQIIEEIGESVKKNVQEQVTEDIKKSFDQEFKDGIKEDIKNDLIEDIKKDISREQRKLSRSKSFKIFRLYIYLIIVVAALLYVLFRLYETDTLTVIDESYTRKTKEGLSTTTTETTTELVKDGDYYIKNYGYLMNDIKISNVDLVKNGAVISEINVSERLAMAYHNIDKDKINVDGIIHTLNENDLMDAYTKLFGSMDGYSQDNFIADGLNYAYSSSNGSFMAIGEEDEDIFIENLLVDGYEEDNSITLEAKSYVIKNNSVYNPNNMNYRIMSVTDDMDITKVQNRLLSVLYRFEKNDNGYILVSITRK